MPDVQADGQPWAVVVPVKRLEVAKTRLSVDAGLRRELALAMAIDSVAACLATPGVVSVVVVTDDEVAAPAMRSLGAQVVRDEPDAGLNPAVRHGAAACGASHPGAAVAVLSSDLAALSADALCRLLLRAGSVAAGCVADAAGTGTTALTARTASLLSPMFGSGSRQRHVEAGVTDLTAYADERLRRDVDTTDDLRDALRLGCGAATLTVVAAHPTVLH